MKHLTTTVSTLSALGSYLAAHRDLLDAARSVLVQLFVAGGDHDRIRGISQAVSAASPRAVIIGCSTDGEILDGLSQSHTTVMSISLFDSATLVPVSIGVAAGGERAAAATMAGHLKKIDGAVRGVVLLATTLSIDCNVVLAELFVHCPGLPLFGGGAGDYAMLDRTVVFHGRDLHDRGIVAVAMVGEALQVLRRTYLGWRPIGKEMTATRVNGFTLQQIDDRPAFEVYRRYLGLAPDRHFFLNALEVPILLKRKNRVLARIPNTANPDGSLTFIADIREGDCLQLGYGDIDLILENARQTQKEIAAFSPEAIYFYSCGVRRFLMQQEVDFELEPFARIAPSAGFFTYGEFCDLGDESPLMNATIVTVALREGPPATTDRVAFEQSAPPERFDSYHYRHVRIVSRLLHILDAVTGELRESNAQMQKQLDEIKQLRGILPICASCKKIRDDQGYWNQLEAYMQRHTDVTFTHGICPGCKARLYPDIEND